MRVLVCGDRLWTDYATMWTVLDKWHEKTPITCIIEGNAKGADVLGGQWGYRNKVAVEVYAANWGDFGRAAGPIRNQQMIDEGKPDYAFAFHGNIDGSRGTADMLKRLARHHIPYTLISKKLGL